MSKNGHLPDFVVTFSYDDHGQLLAALDGTLVTAEVAWTGQGLWRNTETGDLMAGPPAAALLMLGNTFMQNMKNQQFFETIVQRSIATGAKGGPKKVREMWTQVKRTTRFL